MSQLQDDTTKAELAQIDEQLKRLQNEFSGILSRRRALLDITDEEMGNAAEALEDCHRDDSGQLCDWVGENEWEWMLQEQVESTRQDAIDYPEEAGESC